MSDATIASHGTILFLFAYNVLRVPERTEKSLVASIKENSISSELPKAFDSRKHKPLSLENRVEAKLADNDVKGAVKILSSDDTLAPFDDVTY